MNALLRWVVGVLCAMSLPAVAQNTLNAYQTIDIRASVWDVWDAVKDFDGVPNWHPMFSGDEIKSGTNNEVGAVRTLTVKDDGPSFDEELLSFDPLDKRFSYRVIDPAPLPVADYVSTLQVLPSGRGNTTIAWRSSFRNNSDGQMTDEEVIGFINDAYRAGLENIKIMLETR
jgi:hypothetical protein